MYIPLTEYMKQAQRLNAVPWERHKARTLSIERAVAARSQQDKDMSPVISFVQSMERTFESRRTRMKTIERLNLQLNTSKPIKEIEREVEHKLRRMRW